MRGKSLLLIAGGAFVLLVLVGMKLLLSDDASSPAVALEERPPGAAPVAAAKVEAPQRTLKPPPLLHAPVVAAPVIVAAPVEDPTPAGPSLEPPPSIDDPTPGTKTPIADKATLREQMNAVEPQVRACLDQLGGTTSGTTLLTWTVASKGGQAIVESSGVDYDATDITDEKLLTCLADTAKQMHFAAVPGALPVLGRRKLTIANGKLADQQFISFSRIY